MSARTEDLVRALTDAMRNTSTKKTSAYDTTATVTRVDGDTAWVHIPGGVDETPVKLTINAVAGDNVQVRVGGGRAFIMGNATAPPTDDSLARYAQTIAEDAHQYIIQVDGDVKNLETHLVMKSPVRDEETGEVLIPGGLHVIPVANGYYLVVSNDGIYMFDPNDILVAKYSQYATVGRETAAHTVISEDGFEVFNDDPFLILEARSSGASADVEVKERSHWNSYWSKGYGRYISSLEYAKEGTTIELRIQAQIRASGSSTWVNLTRSAYFVKGTSGTSTVTYETSSAQATLTFDYDGNYGFLYTENTGYIRNPRLTYIIYTKEIDAPYFTLGTRTADSDNGGFSSALGIDLIAENDAQCVVGKYNEASSDDIFIVGGGSTNTNRKNLLSVTEDGETLLELDTNAASGTVDQRLYSALQTLGWDSDVLT